RRQHVRRDSLRGREPISEHGTLGVDERLHGLQTRVERRDDEVLALACEQTELVALTTGLELADELEARVGGRGDQAADCSSADFARSTIFANAGGSFTARSASTLRSSVISALRQPETNWLYES